MDENTSPPAVPAPPFSAPGPPEEPAPRKRTADKQTPRKATSPAGPPAKRAPARKSPRTGSLPVVETVSRPAPEPDARPAAEPAAKAPAAKKAPAARKTAPAKKSAAKRAPAKKAPAKKAAPATKAAQPPAPAPEPVEEPAAVELPVAAETAEEVATLPPAQPAQPASEADVAAAWKDNRLAQVLYHDWEAQTYDDKWSISFDDRCISYARDRFAALLGPEILRTEGWPYGKALEIGAGTGFFSLNLKQAGVLGDVTVSDVSAGMVEAAQENARKLGFAVEGAVAGAEALPFEDDTFDVIVGHAVIHHIPDVESAIRELLRVLRPGGRFVIAGEPTRIGDWYARRLGRITWKATTRVTRLPRLRESWAKSQEELDASSRAAALESVVDLHTFVPSELAETAERAGAVEVHTQTEEFLAALMGWPVRTFESAVNPERLGWGWAMFAYRSWLRLSAVDRALGRVLPDRVFYNVGVTGLKPVR